MISQYTTLPGIRPAYILLAALLLTGAAANAQQARVIDSIVAVVDQDVIMRSELNQAIASIVSRLQAEGGNLPPRDLLEKQVLENLILTRLEIQRASQTNIRVSDADVDQALMQVAQQNRLSVDQLRRAIEADGFDFTEFRRTLGEDIMSQRLRQRVIDGSVNVSETEVDILLASDALNSGEYNLAHIQISVPDGATPAQIAEAKNRADDVYSRLQNGLDFRSAAITYSDAQDALQGGEIGWRDLNSVPRLFADAIAEVSVGETTSPLRSPAGYHIIHVLDHRDTAQVIVREFRAKHIMIQTNELVSPRDALQTIQELHRRLKDGESFADLAKEHSDDVSSANLGGDLGWFEPATFGGRVQQTLESLVDGQLSEPFQSQSGWHLIQRVAVRETDRTDEMLRASAKEKIRQRKADVELNQFLRRMRDEAYVDIRLSS